MMIARIILFTIVAVYFAFTGVNDLLSKPRTACPAADDLDPGLPFVVGKGVWEVKSTHVDAASAWRARGFTPETIRRTWGGTALEETFVEVKGKSSQLAPVTFAIERGAASWQRGLVAALAEKFRKNPVERTLRFAELRFLSSEKSTSAIPFGDSGWLLFLDAGLNPPASVPSAAEQGLLVGGDFASRGLVRVTGGLFKTHSGLGVACVRNTPMFTRVTSRRGPLLAESGFPTVFLAPLKAWGPTEIDEFARGVFRSVYLLGNSPS